MSRHVMEALGKAKVIVENGKVVEITEPEIKYCPLFAKHRGIKEITKESIKENIEFRIKDFGLFTKDRIVEESKYIVPFGASEILMSALKRKAIDVAVIVADCAGTVITANPKLVQGLCGRISGIIETSPIPEVIERIEKSEGIVLDKKTAEINQFKGVKKAIELGYKKIAVTVTNLEDAKRCKSLENDEIKILTFGVHTTGIEENEEIAKYFDLITACASKVLREKLKGKIKAQIGKTIPIFALSDFGKEILLERAKDLDNVLITIEDLPVLNNNQPKPLI
ncbi:methanogenesis marker 8 protein [Methanocaldococcus sp. 16A]